MKTIVIGASNSGKTTVIRYLRGKFKLPISEIDEELTAANNGVYPTDFHLKNDILVPKIKDKIINSEDVLFFCNTDYFDINDLKKAKEKGFKIVQLDLSIEILRERNAKRMKEENYPDSSEWLPDMVEYEKEIFEAGVVDKVIDASLPVEKIGEEIIRI